MWPLQGIAAFPWSTQRLPKVAEEDSFVQQEDGGNEEREGGGLKEPVYNLLGSLTAAWKVVEQLEDAQIEADDTFEKILKLLDQSFQYVWS